MQGFSIGRTGTQLHSTEELMSLHGVQNISTDGIFVCVACLTDGRAHFRHGLNRDDALDGKVRLVADSQSIRRRPASSTIVSHE
jgi:hypothetical protein